MPAVRQKRSKLAPTSCQAFSTIATGMTAAIVVNSFMALLSFVDSAPRAYRLKVGNACPPISTSTGTSPRIRGGRLSIILCRIARRGRLSNPHNPHSGNPGDRLIGVRGPPQLLNFAPRLCRKLPPNRHSRQDRATARSGGNTAVADHRDSRPPIRFYVFAVPLIPSKPLNSLGPAQYVLYVYIPLNFPTVYTCPKKLCNNRSKLPCSKYLPHFSL